MEYLWFILLGLGVLFLMSRGRGAMGCCGGGHGNDHSESPDYKHTAHKSSAESKDNVIDLREDEYAVITTKDDRPASS